MLVLSRKANQKIMIGDNIVVTIVRIDRNQVRIGIEAPNNVRVFRDELIPSTGTESDREAELTFSA